MPNKKPNANKLWDKEELTLLGSLWRLDANLQEMAVILGRSGSSVCAQLVSRGYLVYSPSTGAYYQTSSWITGKSVMIVDRFMNEDSDVTIS